MNSRWEVMKDSKSKEFLNQEQAEKFAGFEFNDKKDSRYSRAKYEALFGYAKGGKTSSQKIYEVEYEIGGKKHTSQFLMYDSDRVENLLPPATKIISIKEKFAKGGKVGKYEIWKELFHLRKDGYAIVSLNGFDESIGYVMGLELDDSEIKKVGERSYKTLYAKGGKVGFEGLAKKVAKRYVGKKVSKEYQAEYGKTYDAKEAKEVGNKVAGKVYQQQVAKKKIIRKLQRKTN